VLGSRAAAGCRRCAAVGRAYVAHSVSALGNRELYSVTLVAHKCGCKTVGGLVARVATWIGWTVLVIVLLDLFLFDRWVPLWYGGA